MKLINMIKSNHYFVTFPDLSIFITIKSWLETFQKRGKDVRIDWVDNGLIALQGVLSFSIDCTTVELMLRTANDKCFTTGIRNLFDKT